MEGLKLWYCSKNLPNRMMAEYTFIPSESERMRNTKAMGLRVILYKNKIPAHISEINVYGLKNRAFIKNKYQLACGKDIEHFLEEINQFNFLEMLEKL